jgi:tRNA(Ile)-lysidine synthase
MAESLVFSENPSAQANLPGNVTVERCYGILRKKASNAIPEAAKIHCPGVTELPQWGLRVICSPAEKGMLPVGNVVLRSRLPGDEMRLPGGTKSLKKLFIDQKIPAAQRDWIPVLADEMGVLAVYGLGVNLNRVSQEETGIQFLFEKI